MRFPILLLLLAPVLAIAQTTHNVEVGGSTIGGTPPYYSPQELTIDVGDLVIWNNVSGTHNVNGTMDHFPSNPEGFSSGEAQSGNWTFEHTFTLPGVYNYHCTQLGHDATQFGMITVLNTSSVDGVEEISSMVLFPNPATNDLVVELGPLQISLAEVIGMDGRTIRSIPVNGRAKLEIPMSGMVAGQYYLRLTGTQGRMITRSFRKE